MEYNYIKKGDCLELMKEIPDKSIDMILCDLPYEKLDKFKWDKNLNSELMWEQYKRIIKDDGIICLFSMQPYTSILITSNLEMYRYNWIWKKKNPTGFLNVNYKPLNCTEDICIFSKGTVGSLSNNPIRYYPQDLIEVNKIKKNYPNSSWRKNKGYVFGNNKLNSDAEFEQKYSNYSTNILEFERDPCIYHPTQKPVDLLEYLIKVYTKENEIVLDNCMGSGSTCIACINTKRKYIGFELNEEYFKTAEERIRNRLDNPNIFDMLD